MKKTLLKTVVLGASIWALLTPFCVFADSSDDLTRLLGGLNSMSADFDQTSLGKKNQPKQHITGQMALQKPGKFRFETKQPTQQLIIANGGQVWIYDADLEQVTKQKIDPTQPGNPAMLLSGSVTTLRNAFTIQRIALNGEGEGDEDGGDGKDSSSWFELRPKSANNMYQSIRLHFVADKLADMQMADNLGQQNSFHFKNVVVNSALSPSQFIFVAPKGVDVIEG